MAIGVQTDMATPALARFGSSELCREFLAPAIAGDMVCCIGVTEPLAGSDVAAIKTRAVRDGDEYVINGSKTFITSGTQADWMCMLANTGEGPVHRNKSLIIVPLKEGGKRAKGVTVAKKLKKLGMHASDTAELYFEDVRVPMRNRIGDEGKGFVYQMKQFQEERMYAALGCITSCTRSIEETIEYTRNRKAFGRPIIENQVVPLSPVRTPDRSGGVARVDLEGRGDSRVRRRLHPVRINGETQGNAAGARSPRRVSAILGWHGIYG
jgi:citronellyl-CoA dehydrogenase